MARDHARQVEQAGDQIRSLANQVLAGSYDPTYVAVKLRRLADELQTLARSIRADT